MLAFHQNGLLASTSSFKAKSIRKQFWGDSAGDARGQVIYFQASVSGPGEDIPMKPDAIFRIASMTKPITSVAVMMLAEEGKIDLLAPCLNISGV